MTFYPCLVSLREVEGDTNMNQENDTNVNDTEEVPGDAPAVAEEATDGTNATNKKEVFYHPPVIPFDPEKVVITSVGFSQTAGHKYQIVMPIPDSEDEAQERYGCTLRELTAAGVRQLSYRPTYPDVGFNEDGTLKDKGHAAMQDLADGYKPGQRRSGGPTQKAKASAFDDLQKEASDAGLTMEEVRELIEDAKA